jgi:hypothetical protein
VNSSQATNGNGSHSENRSEQRHKTKPPMPSTRRQATAVELAALLMEAVCVTGSSEEEAVEEMAQIVGVPAQQMLSELMFLRAFAVEFGADLALGDCEEKRAIFERYYDHWEMVAGKTDGNLVEDLHESQEYYTNAVHSPTSEVSGLTGPVGVAFAARCRAQDDGREDLAMFGGSLFAALFDEIAELLQSIEILPSPDSD